ncbi:MAG: hypothetical protein LUP95_00680, partial [Euryarchaeota archaeon]|nr:hypothetical protein [Euryarchaeota archaeon]
VPVLNPSDVLLIQTSRHVEIVTSFQLLMFSVAGAILVTLTGIGISSLIKRGRRTTHPIEITLNQSDE